MSIAQQVKNKLNGSTQAQSRNVSIQANNAAIMQLLQITADQYQAHLMENEMHYAAIQCAGHDKVLAELLACDEYSAWFLNQWQQRNDAFMRIHNVHDILRGNNAVLLDVLRNMYYDTHTMAMNGPVMANGYSLIVNAMLTNRFKPKPNV